MSLQTWKQEFYPITAKCVAENENSTIEEVIQHSLRKWIGLRPKNLKKHGLEKLTLNTIGPASILEKGNLDYDETEVFGIGSQNCSLCILYHSNCEYCELAKARNGESCCTRWASSKSSYLIFMETADPEPMIKDLQKALEMSRRSK